MTEAYETILRKSLDKADRWRKLTTAYRISLILGILLILAGKIIIVPAMINLKAVDQNYLIYVATVVAGALFISGLTLIVIAASYRNTRLILRAIQLASEAARETAQVSSTQTTSSEA